MRKLAIRFSVLLAMIIAAVICFGVAFADYDDIRQLYEQGQVLMAQEQWTEAAEIFSQLGGYEEASILSVYCLAVSAGEQGQYELAIAAADYPLYAGGICLFLMVKIAA